MGNYRVIYLEDLENAEVFVECPVCKRIKRNVIEPVALIVEKDDFESVKREINSNQPSSIDDIKNSDYINKILNKDDLVCIFHQKKESKHWEEDTKEFEEWNKEVLYSMRSFYSLNENNLVNKFWERIRAYRFAVDNLKYFRQYKTNLELFNGNVRIPNLDLVIDELKKYKKLLFFYFINLRKEIYNFEEIKFPVFFYYSLENSERILELKKLNPYSHKLSKNLKYSLNFWYKGEYFKFEKDVNFYKSSLKKVCLNLLNTNKLYLIFAEVETISLIKSKINSLIIRNSEIYGSINTSNSEFESIEIINANKNISNLIFESIRVQSILEINKLNVAKDFILDNSFYSSVSINELYINNNISFKNCEFKSFIYIKDLECENIYFNSSKIKKLTIFNSKIKIVSFRNAKFEGKFVNINKSNLESFKFNYVNIKDIFVLKLEATFIKYFSMNGVIDSFKFINCDFSQAEEINIRDSYLEETIFANVNWGEISEKRICPELFEKEPDKARDIYRQIKLSLDKQADYINANWFYALEMKAYEKYLQSKSKFENFQEKTIFTLHKFISNFGLSWTRPFVLIIFFTLIMLSFGITTPNNKVVIPIIEKSFYIDFFMPILVFIYFGFAILDKLNKDAVIQILAIAFSLSTVIYISNLTGFGKFLDDFATTLNIFNVFKIFSKDEQGNFANAPHYFDGYYFIYKLYAIFILVLIYQLIVAIRRRVRR